MSPAAGQVKNLLFEPGTRFTWRATLDKHIKDKTISQSDYDIIAAFLEEKTAPGMKDTIGPNRAQRVASALCNLRRFHPEYAGTTDKTILSLARGLATGVSDRGTKYTDNTRKEMLVIFKMFTNYLKVDMAVWKKIDMPATTTISVTATDCLDDAKINKLIDACGTTRDKAVVAMMAETGCRPKELGNLRWKDITFTVKSIHVHIVDAKDPTKSKTAFVALRQSIIKDLWNSQALDEQDDYVFRQFVGSNSTRIGPDPIGPTSIRNIMQNASAATGIRLPKGAKAKLLRASSVTNKLAAGVPQAAIMKTVWSSGLNSRMFEHYEKLSPVQTENLIMAASGETVEVKPVATEDNTKIKCSCGYENTPRSRFCSNCGLPLWMDATKMEGPEIHGVEIVNGETRYQITMTSEQLADLVQKEVAEAVAAALAKKN